MPWLINTDQFEKFRKSQKNIIILDASFHLDNRQAKEEYLDKHIIDAQFFDMSAFHDENTSVPFMLIQDEKIISEKLGQMGIRHDSKIILYDNSGLHSSARALWMFKMFGHNPHLLYILDGGMKAFEANDGKIESGPKHFSQKIYKAELQPQYCRTLQQMKANLNKPQEQIVDLRHPVRYAGGPETRPGIRSGHIPGSYSLPYFILFNKDGTLLPQERIRKKLIDVGLDLQVPIVSTCGSGMTAAILDFALDLLGHTTHAVYDGSWSEWGSETLYPGEENLSERPIETCID